MIKNVIMVLQVIAVFCAYLVMSIPVISASQISVYVPGSAPKIFSVDPAVKVERNITVVHDPSDYKWENVQVKVEIVGKDPGYALKKIYLFKCKNSSPGTCSGYGPVVAKNYLSGEKGTFYWNDVSANSVAGFMSIVEMEYAGKTVWVGFWDEIERTGLQSFEHSSYELDSIDVHAKSGVDGEWIKNYIEDYYMIPMRWVERVLLGVIGGKMTSKMYKLSADQAELDTHIFESQTEQGNAASPGSKDYTFVFGKGSVSSPVTLFSGSPFTCGNAVCESAIGENKDSCCIDCGCGAGEECTASCDYPSGVCHECGNGILEPTENSSTCCADAGCPTGKSCDSARNPPYGTCVLPDCGNARCDTPEENIDNCCIDCGSDPGCASKHGSGYYCNDDLISCVQPECGNGNCEPGEDYTNCCADCAGCPSGEFCNVNVSESGVCMPTTCGNDKCEPGEDYTNCCLDCDGCPLDPFTGSQQTCSLNTCHLCGNGELEPPAESESTCCQDSGCSSDDDYCPQQGGCMPENEMGVVALVVPEEVDCTLDDPISIKITLENRPQYFDYFRSAYYDYAGYQKRMMCQENGNEYDCEIPVTGPDSFPGCFEPGPHTINLTVNVYYFKDNEAERDFDSDMAALSGSATFNVQKARSRVCNRNGACELGIGETPESCCWDCGCGASLICTAAGCAGESAITMRVDESSFPSREQIDCWNAVGRITFSATVLNVPYSADDPFRLVDQMLFYGDRNFTAENLPGFSCEPESGTGEMLTGRVECSIPVSVFPACPYEPPASMELRLYVLGGGLSDIYGAYTGLELNDSFQVEYVKGLPNCGNGAIDEGETSENCCRDLGCPDGKLCSLYSGCIDESQLDLSVSVDPYSINCSRSSGEISFTAEVDPKPISLPRFEDTYLNRSRIDNYCEVGLLSDYTLQCNIPLVEFPYCWLSGVKHVTFDTTMLYGEGNDTRGISFTKPVEFYVSGVRQRECDMDGVCEYKIGEIPDLCCADCGCTAGNVCTLDNKCMDSSEIMLRVDSVDPVDCSGQSGYFVTIDAEIKNQPYGTEDVDWTIRMGSDVYGSDIFSCGIREGENKYQCEISVYNLPLCHSQDIKTMTLVANVSHIDALGYYHSTIAEDGVTISTSNWLDSCTNPITGGTPGCQPELGETQQTCCQDCGCDSFGPEHVCTANGCQSKSVVSMSISPASITTECTLLPAEADIGKTSGSITKYLCQFRKPVEIEANIQNLPVYSTDPIDLFYYLDGNKSGKIQDSIASTEKTATGWLLKVLPKPVESSTKNIKRDHKLALGFTLVVYDQENEIIIPLESKNEIGLDYNVKESDKLISVENQLGDYKEGMKKLEGYIKIIFFIFGFCTPCFGYALLESELIIGAWGLLVDIFGWFAPIIFGYSIAAGIGIFAASTAGFLGAYAIGLAAGTALCHATLWKCCTWLTKPCVVISIIAAAAMLFIMNKMKDTKAEVKNDIQKDISLAKAEVGDDLSFYYGQGGEYGG